MQGIDRSLFTHLSLRERIQFPIRGIVSILLCMVLVILCFVRRVPHL